MYVSSRLHCHLKELKSVSAPLHKVYSDTFILGILVAYCRGWTSAIRFPPASYNDGVTLFAAGDNLPLSAANYV